jgi:addiction module HigA family antidote
MKEACGRKTAPHLRVATILGVRRATLSDIVNGRASLSPEMALLIEKVFDANMDTLLHMQA